MIDFSFGPSKSGNVSCTRPHRHVVTKVRVGDDSLLWLRNIPTKILGSVKTTRVGGGAEAWGGPVAATVVTVMHEPESDDYKHINPSILRRCSGCESMRVGSWG